MSEAVGGVGSGANMNIERFARVVSMQKNAMQEAGQQTLKLIQSAALPDGQGQRLDVKA
jgi:hypothetical protein